MAGSYKHCTNRKGNFRTHDFHELIENLRDAYEACEEMHWMINYLAHRDTTLIEEALAAFYKSRKVRT